MNSTTFKKLIGDVGVKKALEIVDEATPPLAGDFSVEHKKMYLFSNEATAAIEKEIAEEHVRGASGRHRKN